MNFPFRELEIGDLFTLEGAECKKVSDSKYLTTDEDLEPILVDIIDTNILVNFLEEEDEDELRVFFSRLLDFAEFLEDVGQESLDIQELKTFAQSFLQDRS